MEALAGSASSDDDDEAIPEQKPQPPVSTLGRTFRRRRPYSTARSTLPVLVPLVA